MLRLSPLLPCLSYGITPPSCARRLSAATGTHWLPVPWTGCVCFQPSPPPTTWPPQVAATLAECLAPLSARLTEGTTLASTACWLSAAVLSHSPQRGAHSASMTVLVAHSLSPPHSARSATRCTFPPLLPRLTGGTTLASTTGWLSAAVGSHSLPSPWTETTDWREHP